MFNIFNDLTNFYSQLFCVFSRHHPLNPTPINEEPLNVSFWWTISAASLRSHLLKVLIKEIPILRREEILAHSSRQWEYHLFWVPGEWPPTTEVHVKWKLHWRSVNELLELNWWWSWCYYWRWWRLWRWGLWGIWI